jgi:RNA polymerase sigma-70 factor, ECF subfamily
MAAGVQAVRDRQEVDMASGDVALRTEVLPAAALERGLVEDCRRGDPQAFARLVAVHEGMVFNLAARLLGDREEARDAAQDVFLQVYRTLGRFQGRSTLKTWIYRIVVNQCRNRQRWWRRRKKDRACPIDTLTCAEEAQVSASAAERPETPFDQLARRERSHEVQQALLTLSFDHRAILLLREVEGLGCEEIGKSLGVPTGTVKSRLARARDCLRLALLARAPQVPR